MEPNPTHLLFDFFGTLTLYSASQTEQGFERTHALLVSSGVELSYEAFLEEWVRANEPLEDHAQRTLEEYSMDQMVAAFLSAQLGSAPSQTLIGAVRDSYLDEWTIGVHAIDGLDGMLERLGARFTLGIITNTHHQPLASGLLSDFGMAHHFDLLLTSVEHGRRKPCPSIFESALGRLGTTATECTYVGDSRIPDHTGATGAGLRAWLIDPDAEADVPAADRLSSILDVERRLS